MFYFTSVLKKSQDKKNRLPFCLNILEESVRRDNAAALASVECSPRLRF